MFPYSHNLPRTRYTGYTGKLKVASISCKTTQIGYSLGSGKRRKPCQEQGKPMNILFYSEDSNICPATTCLDYVNRTINFRKNQDNLFLSIKKPHKAITKSTIARWIKSILSLAGINTNMFTAHLTRAVSSSTAKNAGMISLSK